MIDRNVALADFRQAIAAILNLAAAELPDESKLMLAQILQNDPGSIRLHVRLEPFTIVGGVFAPDRNVRPFELFTIHGDLPSGAFQ